MIIYKTESTKLPVAELGMFVEKMFLVLRQIRLFLPAVRALARRRRRRAVVALPSFDHLFVAGCPPVQNSVLDGGEIHRAERAEIRRRG